MNAEENKNTIVLDAELISSLLVTHIGLLEKKFDERFSKFENSIRNDLKIIQDKIDSLSLDNSFQSSFDDIKVRLDEFKKSSKKKSFSTEAIHLKKSSSMDVHTTKKSRRSNNAKQMELLIKKFPTELLDVHSTTIQKYFHRYIEKQKICDKRNGRRKGIVTEIFETEKNYIETLNTIVKLYMTPLLQKIESNTPIISKYEYKIIFGEVKTILGINNVIFGLIEPRINTWTSQSLIGDVFLNIAESLKIYTKFFDGYSTAIDLLKNAIHTNKNFASFVKEAENNPESKMQDLMLMLITPIQRIFRYQTMLTALLDATPEDHPDFINIQKSIEKIKEVNEFVNEKKKESEGTRKLMEIQTRLEDYGDTSIVKENRMYIAEITLKEQNDSIYKLFLFSDSILLTSPNNNTLRFQQFCGLEGCRVKSNEDFISLRTPTRMYSFNRENDDVKKFFDAVENTTSFFNKKLKSSSTVNPRMMFNEMGLNNKSSTVSKSLSMHKARPVLDLKATFKLDIKRDNSTGSIVSESKKDSNSLKKSKSEFKKSRPKSWHEKLDGPSKKIQSKE